MTISKPLLKLSIWEERLCADELLFELRAAVWQLLAPRLLIEPPSFETSGGNGVGEPCYLTAICPANPNLETRALEVALMKSEYDQALYEIEAAGNLEEWQSFMQTKMRLCWVKNKKVRQKPRTSAAVRRSAGAIFKQSTIFEYDESVRLLV